MKVTKVFQIVLRGGVGKGENLRRSDIVNWNIFQS